MKSLGQLISSNQLISSKRIGYGAILFAALLSGGLLQASPVISYQVTSLGTQNGQATFRYNYTLSGIDLLANEEVDIRFSPNFGPLTNGVASSDFDLLLLNPNSPQGSEGDYSALAKVDHPLLAGPFSVDFTFDVAQFGQPGSQEFFLYDDRGPVSIQIGSGVTTPFSGTTAPEPGSIASATLASLFIAGGFLFRRRLRQTKLPASNP